MLQQGRLVALLLSASLLGGCVALAAGGAATGVMVAHDRRTTGTVVEDQNIELKAYAKLREDEALWAQSHINVTSFNLNVLITGETPSPEFKQRIEAAVRGLDRVKTVYNELSIAAPAALSSRSSDALISTRVKTALFGVDQPDFDPTRVKVKTERGTVYLLGLLTQAEADEVTEVTRRVRGVQRVVKLFEAYQPDA